MDENTSDHPDIAFNDSTVAPGKKQTLFELRPGQIVNLKTYALCALGMAVVCYLFQPGLASIGVLAIGLLGGWEWLKLHSKRYVVTNQQIEYHFGVFNPDYEHIPLYKIYDSKAKKPFEYRPFSRGNVYIYSHDHTRPFLLMEAIPRPYETEEAVRVSYEQQRQARGTRYIE